MSTVHIERLLAELKSDDPVAAEQVFRTYEPYLRMLVRRELHGSLRRKFDSLDVVQSVWAELIEGVRDRGWRFTDPSHLRAFLIRLTRHRFIDLCRKHRQAAQHEERLSDNPSSLEITSAAPRPSELARRNELWDRILALCPPEHHELLRLKLQGRSHAEIGAEAGMHPNSVRRILAGLAERVEAANGRTARSSGPR
jgi:RNA polymerase sigma-70 factor (ECF subfamily)